MILLLLLFFRIRKWFLVFHLVWSYLLLVHHFCCRLVRLQDFLFLRIYIHLFLFFLLDMFRLCFLLLLYRLLLLFFLLRCYHLHLLWCKHGVLGRILFLLLVVPDLNLQFLLMAGMIVLKCLSEILLCRHSL